MVIHLDLKCIYNCSFIGAIVEVFLNADNVLQGFFFRMSQVISAYPELLCMDATYKLLELRFPLYVMLVEDGNGISEVATAFLLLEETEVSLKKMMDTFKKNNAAWESVRVIMTDKDILERDVLARSFPNATPLICLFHTFRTFKREITAEKMGISSGQRNLCLELLQQLAYAPSEIATMNYMQGLKHLAHHLLLNILMITGMELDINGLLE